jgi:hypothetical protein
MKTTFTRLLAAAAFVLAAPVHASVLNFDDLQADATLSSMDDHGPYGGFSWGQWFLGNSAVEGYDNAARSGLNYLMNGFGVDELEVAGAGLFDLAGAWFVAPNINGAKASWINISAYDAANQLIGSTGNVAIDGTYRWVAANFTDVSRVVITRDDGFFAMDDFTLQGSSTVPEPGTLALFGAGLALALGARRKAKRSAAC